MQINPLRVLTSKDISYRNTTVEDALDNTETQLISRANIKKGVNWNTAETIPLNTNLSYSLKCGMSSGYSDLYIVNDGGWKIFGTNDIGVTISGNNLIIPRYVRYLLIW